ncbi:MAG: hypothetical protein EXX96DRAFT_653069 [Benjaminiella poitrasii]|nr:MAG: hypothetical protein EXX96DRAFT_653069 [Benjaminiella poitrasii]
MPQTIFQKAANLGHDVSEVITALSLIHGKGVDKNCQEGFTRLKDLADTRNSSACVELGKLYRDGIPDFLEKNYHYALFYFKRADTRDGDVQYYIGMLYDQGHDESKFPVNYVESTIWLDRAATEYSLGEARYRLGIKYWKGIGFAQDYYEAKNWFCQAGHCGKYEAYYYIGKCFFHGLGGRKDMERVVHYLEQYILHFPKNQVSGEVEFMLGFAYYAGDGFLLSANNRKALKHFRNAIACNYKSAYYYTGVIYEGCRGVSQDLNAVVHYLEQSGTKRAILSAKQLSATKSENASKQNTATDTEKKDAASEHNVTLVEEQQKTAPTQAALTQNVPPKEKESKKTTENPKPVENTCSNKSNSDSKETPKQKQQEQQLNKEGDSSSNDVTANKEEKKNATENKEEIEKIPTVRENSPLLIDTKAVKEQTAVANENQSLAPDSTIVTCQTSYEPSMEQTIHVLVEAL